MMWLALKYAFFAVLAIGANLSLQVVTRRIYSGTLELYLSMAMGTAAGLVVKYLLDKTYIFYDRNSGLADEGRKFSLYTATGVATTLVFWGCEILFDRLFETVAMRYLGALVGLTMGYLAKYQLDKRLVFKRATGR